MLGKNQIKEIQSLQLKKFRDSRKLFICEGQKTIAELLAQQPGWVREVYGLSDFILRNENLLAMNNIRHTEVTAEELKKISLQSAPGAALAVCRQPQESTPVFNFNQAFSFYLDDIRDPGNMGTIIRLCDWFGIPVVFCSHESCERFNPKVIQATMGAFLRVQVVYIALEKLVEEHHITHVYGGVLNGKDLFSEKLSNGLIVIGNEAGGIREENLSLIRHGITIPSGRAKGAESLNAAMAASIIAAEFYRQLQHLG
jgi:TrmH family RNA methyltransferase